MVIFDTPEKDLTHGEEKAVTRKVHESSVNSSLTLFLCSVSAMYNRVHRDQNQRLMLKSFIPGLD